MPGVAQLWLSEDELELLEDWGVRAREDAGDNPMLWQAVDNALLERVQAAQETVACPTEPSPPSERFFEPYPRREFDGFEHVGQFREPMPGEWFQGVPGQDGIDHSTSRTRPFRATNPAEKKHGFGRGGVVDDEAYGRRRWILKEVER